MEWDLYLSTSGIQFLELKHRIVLYEENGHKENNSIYYIYPKNALMITFNVKE
jgi:hypothetical protein